MENLNIIKSNRKTISIEITKELSVLVRAPKCIKDKNIVEFVDSKKAWIDKNIKLMQQRNDAMANIHKLTTAEIESLVSQAKMIISQRVEYYTQIIGVDYVRITIRKQVSRWGSCSAKGNLNFNCLLMLAPAEVVDYIVVHELCHRKEMNHSAKFWSEVKHILPNYEASKKWLKDNGSELIGRLKNG